VEFGRSIVKKCRKKRFLPNLNRIMQKIRKKQKMRKLIVKNVMMHAKTQTHFSKDSNVGAATGFECALQATLCMDSIQSDAQTARPNLNP